MMFKNVDYFTKYAKRLNPFDDIAVKLLWWDEDHNEMPDGETIGSLSVFHVLTWKAGSVTISSIIDIYKNTLKKDILKQIQKDMEEWKKFYRKYNRWTEKKRLRFFFRYNNQAIVPTDVSIFK